MELELMIAIFVGIFIISAALISYVRINMDSKEEAQKEEL